MRHRKKLSVTFALAGLVPLLFSAVQPASAATAAPARGSAAVVLAKGWPAIARGVPAAQASGDAPQAINQLGVTRYASLYAGDIVNSDGSVTVLLGPGSAASFRDSLNRIVAGPGMKAFGRQPSVKIERVPQSIGTLDSVSQAVGNHASQLKAAGYQLSGWAPDPRQGTVQVALSAAPAGVSVSDATRYLQRTVSAHLVVTSVSAPVADTLSDREQDQVPFYAGDLIYNSAGQEACTSGFTVIGTVGYPRAMTDAHCGNSTFTNGGLTITNGKVTRTSGAVHTFGTTSNYHFGSRTSTDLGSDVQLLENPDENGFGPYIWVGAGTAQPTAMAVTNAITGYPAAGQELTVDGAFTRTVRYVPVLAAGAGVCQTAIYNAAGNTITLCGLIELSGTSATGVTPTATQGDSGGAVFCYACSSAGVEPAGLIWATLGTNGPVFATDINNDLGKTGARLYETP